MGPRRQENYSSEEDKAIARAWIQTSEDAIVGTSQKKSGLWDNILMLVNIELGSTIERTASSIASRWGLLQKEISKFHSILNCIDRNNPSGANAEYRYDNACSIYKADNNKKNFKFKECFEIVKDNPKWNDLMMRSSERPRGSGHKKQRSDGELSGGTVGSDGSTPTQNLGTISLDDDENDLCCEQLRASPKEVRPHGTKAAKLKKAQSSASTEVMQGFVDKYAKRQQKYDQDSARDWELRQENLTVKKNMVDYFTKRKEEKETESDLEAMKMDVESMKGVQKEFWKLRQESILAKWKAEGKFGTPAPTPARPPTWAEVPPSHQYPTTTPFGSEVRFYGEPQYYGGGQFGGMYNPEPPQWGSPPMFRPTPRYTTPHYPTESQGGFQNDRSTNETDEDDCNNSDATY